MSEKVVLEQLAELTRRMEALEARLGEIERSTSLHDAEPVYRIAENEVEENVAVPAKVLRASGLSPQELLVELAVHLFEEDFISLGVAKSLAGMNTARFMKLLASRNISLHYDVKELEEDVATLKQMGLL